MGIPSIDGKVCVQTVDSLLAEQFLAHEQGVHLLVQWRLGVSLIGVARNQLAADFLAVENADCMVFVDADIAWSPGDLVRLAKQPQDVIGATYRAKREVEDWHVFGTPERVGDLYRVDGLPGGFLKISRTAFQSIDANVYQDRAGRMWRDYFPTGFHDGRFYGEDYGFCRLWRKAGGMVWLDPSIKLRHMDGSRAYTGDPAEWLRGRA